MKLSCQDIDQKNKQEARVGIKEKKWKKVIYIVNTLLTLYGRLYSYNFLS